MEAWAAAKHAVISGATGLNADTANGEFEQVEREVYRKVGDLDRWLFVDVKNKWIVGNTANKDVRKTKSSGFAYLVAAAGRMPPPAGPSVWKVSGGNGWVEQTLQVGLLSAAQVRW